MFAKIPQSFAAPFGLLPDSRKLAFRSQPDGLSKLITIRVCISAFIRRARTNPIFPEYIRNRQLLESGRLAISCANQLKCTAQYIVLFDSASEVFSLISPNDSSCNCHTI